jgi:hypothetical protein
MFVVYGLQNHEYITPSREILVIRTIRTTHANIQHSTRLSSDKLKNCVEKIGRFTFQALDSNLLLKAVIGFNNYPKQITV